MFRKDFLEKALASKDQRQQLNHLLRVTAPHERLLLAGIGVLLLVALAVWAFFGSITLGLRLEGVLIEPGDRYEVMAAEPGHLVDVVVSSGERGFDKPVEQAPRSPLMSGNASGPRRHLA